MASASLVVLVFGALASCVPKGGNPTLEDEIAPGRVRIAAVVCADDLYAIGGQRAKGPADRYPVDSYTSIVERFALPRGLGERLPSLPRPLSGAKAVAIKDTIYCIGGGALDAQAKGMIQIDTTALKSSYRMLPGPSIPRSSFEAVVFGGHVWILGGNRGGIDSEVREIERFDPSTQTWEMAGLWDRSRSDFCAVPIEAGILVLGGHRRGESHYTDRVELFDPTRNHWKDVGRCDPRWMAAAVSHNGCVWTFGGAGYVNPHKPGGSIQLLDTIERFDVKSGDSQVVGRLNTPRSRLSAISLKGVAYVFGGFSDESPQYPTDIEIVRLRSP